MAILGSTTAPAWHKNPLARAAFNRIDPARLHVSMQRVVPGPYRMVFTGEPVEALDDLREKLIGEAFGCSFGEAYDAGRADEFFAFYLDQPSVSAAIEDYFDVPLSHCNPWDMTMATAQWRSYVGVTPVVEAA